MCKELCECLFLMRSERASRVCIVVLEEVEEDEPSSSSPPPRPKSSLDCRSHHASCKAAVQDDKVRWACLYGFFAIELVCQNQACLTVFI